jgi:hypothetical protein
MDTVEILEKARELISDESRWTRGWFAKTADGYRCNPLSLGAECFCALGALSKVMGTNYGELTGKTATERLRSSLPSGCNITGFNDSATHAEVLDLFDRAIAAARAS